MHILLTNDDSHDSPLFLQAIAHLQQFGRVSIVVPAQEQSWQGKSMTRYGPVYVDKIDLHGHAAYSVSGTPADCVNIGIYNLLDERPDIVVSGVNLGLNTGVGFAMASGTLGACFEANIAGIPGIAMSQQVTKQDHEVWDQERRLSDAAGAEMEDILARMLPQIWQQLVVDVEPSPTTYSVNFPRSLNHDELVHTRLGQSFYQKCFQKRGDQYHHSMSGFSLDDAPDTDFAVLQTGRASVAHFDLRTFGQ